MSVIFSAFRQGDNLLIACLLVLSGVCLPSVQARAACSYSGNSPVYTWTAATSGNDASLTFQGNWRCDSTQNMTPVVNPHICVRLRSPAPATSVNPVLADYRVEGTVGGLRLSGISPGETWLGPAPATDHDGVIPVSLTVSVQTGKILPSAGTFFRSLQMDLIRQESLNSGICEPHAGEMTGRAELHFSYVIPPLCSLGASGAVNFGTLSDIGITHQSITAEGRISAICSPGQVYTLSLGNGSHPLVTGLRRMSDGSGGMLPYQLYQDPAYQRIWEQGGEIMTGNAGVTTTGTGSLQTFPVFGHIPAGTMLPAQPGSYSDTVVVTLTW